MSWGSGRGRKSRQVRLANSLDVRRLHVIGGANGVGTSVVQSAIMKGARVEGTGEAGRGSPPLNERDVRGVDEVAGVEGKSGLDCNGGGGECLQSTRRDGETRSARWRVLILRRADLFSACGLFSKVGEAAVVYGTALPL